MNIKFRISAPTLVQLNQHLFSGDGNEAVAFILCGHLRNEEETVLLAHKVIPLSYESCPVRKPDKVTWITKELATILNIAEKENLAIVKVHCHPGGFAQFSEIDDHSDSELFPSIYNWAESDLPGLSAILLPGNELVVRHVSAIGEFSPVAISIIGDEVSLFPGPNYQYKSTGDFETRNLQVFGSKTRNLLSQMKVAVIGCSGTGSPVIEQLNRLGIGTLVLIDPDVVEEKNLNRITNTTSADAESKKFKVYALKDALVQIGLGTNIRAFNKSIFNPGMIKELASCDFIFGCVDSAEARCLINRISHYYLVPYIDIGICLDADGEGGVTHISGKVAYFQPGKSDHLSRKSVLAQTVEAESLKRSSSKLYEDRLNEGYIRGVDENSPAIIPVNTYASTLAVMEFLARIHDYRNEPNNLFAEQVFCFVNDFRERKSENDFNQAPNLAKSLGRGDIELLLDMPEFSKKMEAA
ncbi:MAG: ThiF family adenylyltransferase [Methylophaga sp.]|nr:ThiF family adenylyltransferase [Methylophaga sp.]